MIIAGVSIFLSCLELVFRLRKQIRRVMDPSLLKTKNYHEVKHWIEPGLSDWLQIVLTLHDIILLEFVSFGWGNYDFNEESKLMDEKKLRKREKPNNETV